MNLLVPGLGFLYAGKLWTALIIPLFLLGFVFFIAWSRLILEPWGVWLIWGGLVLAYLLLIPLVFISARRNNPCQLKPSQHGVLYLLFSLIFLSLIGLTIHFRATLFGYETFHLPSRSMANTLLPNDYIIVDTWAYFDEKPHQGDILVFKYPLNPDTYFTKRMIAGAGDQVLIQKGKVAVNNIQLVEPYVLASNNLRTSKNRRIKKVVNEGSYFVMGDNRDHSNDSRSWGDLAEGAIYGKAVSVWFSFSSQEGVRMKRIRKLSD